MSAAAHANLVHEVNSLRKTLNQTLRTLDAVQDRLSTFETSQKRMEVQLDLLVRMQQPVAMPTFAAQALPDQPGRISIRLKETNVKHGRCTQFSHKLSVYTRPLLATTVNGTVNRGRSFVLNTSDTTFVCRYLAFINTWSPTT